MIPIIANICGFLAVAMFVFSYQFKNRNALIFINAGSRVLYILQYILLGAFEGAVMDCVALIVSVLAKGTNKANAKKYMIPMIIFSNLLIIAAGLLTYKDIFSLLHIVGVIFETGALWLVKEKNILILSAFGAPFWLAYNLIFRAYGASCGNVLTLVSIGLALIRQSSCKQKKES